MHLERSRRGASEGGANIEIIDMRYMWSAIDSPLHFGQYRIPSYRGNACALSPSDTKSSPSFSLRSLQSLEHMEKLQRRARSLGWRTSGKFLNCLSHRPRAINLDDRRKPQVWENAISI